jgi:hypothetical protein
MNSKNYIKSKIKAAKLNITSVSIMMGYSSTAGLSNMLRNPKKLSIEQASKLAEIINLKPQSLLSRIAKD